MLVCIKVRGNRSHDFAFKALIPPLKLGLKTSLTQIHGHIQRWSREHKARGQGHKKVRGQGQPFRGQTLSRPRTGMLEANDQGHRRKCFPQKLSLKIFVRRSSIEENKKESSQILREVSSVFRQNLIGSKNSAVHEPRIEQFTRT